MGATGFDATIFRSFLTVVAGVLGVGGVTIATLRFVLRRDLQGVVRTYRSWLVMAPLPFIAMLAGREAVIGLCFALSVYAFSEYAKATDLSKDRLMQWFVIGGIVAQSLTTLVTDPRTMKPGWYGMFMALPVFSICAIALVPVLRNKSSGQLRIVSLAAFAYLYFGWMLGHLGFLANAQLATGYLLYLLFAVSTADVAAFTFGSTFGRRKLCDQISPNKTLAGSFGAIAVSMTLPWLLSFALPGFSAFEKLLVGLIIGVGGQLGDLTISYIKRDLGIKDMGRLIPGHGGLLDRVDSLILTAPLFFHMIRWFRGV